MLRIIGLILVVIGSLALGYEGFRHVAREQGACEVGEAVWEQDLPLSFSPVLSGIAVVSGLLLLASGGQRGEE